jgi:hypothetical protein
LPEEAPANNLVKQNPEKAGELHKLLKAWREDIGASVRTEPNPEYKP